MARIVSKEADEVLDIKIKVLDKGFVRLVDYMGGDERVVSAARVSFGKGSTTPERDAALINYLMEHEHTSPFEQVVLTFHVRLPIFVARQWIRHRTARVNEISGRYAKLPADWYVPEDWRTQDEVNKQGSLKDEDDVLDQIEITDDYNSACHRGVAVYGELANDGVAREMARMCLPLSTYTEWYWQIDLHNLFHFLQLRMDEHAQWEIRQYAEVMMDIAQRVAPVSCAAFKKYVLDTVRVPKDEYERLKSKGE
jgi:thymidylate synthase (FAD)